MLGDPREPKEHDEVLQDSGRDRGRAGHRVAAGGTGIAKTTTPAAKPASADKAAKLMADHRGGTLKLLARAAGGSLDPQVNYTLQYWQLYRATQDGLVTYKAAGGDAAFEIVPDLAAPIPKPTNDGKTWTFTLRKGIKYSNGKTVDAA